jgi:hypothetical protein
MGNIGLKDNTAKKTYSIFLSRGFLATSLTIFFQLFFTRLFEIFATRKALYQKDKGLL